MQGCGAWKLLDCKKKRNRHACFDFLLSTAEKVSSLGKDWHKFCLKCERCNKTLTPGGHAEHDGKPFCHKPCYATLFGPKGNVSRVLARPQTWDSSCVCWGSICSFLLCAPPTLKAMKQLWEKLCVRWVGSGSPTINLLACLPSAGVNIGGAGSYIYEKPSTEAPQVTGPIEVPLVRTEERKTSGPPKGPSKGRTGSGVGVGYGWPRSTLTQFHPSSL